ncbi:MAG: hypothetical protein ACTSPI_00840 [Candidatus Heimdallarchaeaceae archaeon]
MKGIQEFELDYEEAKRYFSSDVDVPELLESLTPYEREGYRLIIIVDHDRKTAEWADGHFWENTEHLPQLGSGIDNAVYTEDDYDGVCTFLREEKLLK